VTRSATPRQPQPGGDRPTAPEARHPSGEPARAADPHASVDRAGTQPDGATGVELARAVLEAARVRREARTSPRRPSAAGGATGGRRLRGYSGPGPDPRDPQPMSALLARLVKVRGWQRPAAEARLFGAWPQVVGPEIAERCRPVKLADGELTIEAESTAWAMQLKSLAGRILARIGEEVGRDIVKRVHVHGPVAPSWGRGPKRVRGRGPRDTYG
jgi:predicted nucleic acid-binding Zn ribbon protein